jgi:hypothetical protein
MEALLIRSQPQRTVGIGDKTVDGPLSAQGTGAPETPMAASFRSLEESGVGANPKVAGRVAGDAPDLLVREPFRFPEALPFFASEPPGETLSAIPNPEGALPVFIDCKQLGVL